MFEFELNEAPAALCMIRFHEVLSRLILASSSAPRQLPQNRALNALSPSTNPMKPGHCLLWRALERHSLMQIPTGISTAAAAHDALAIAPDDAFVGTSRRHPSRLKMEDNGRNSTYRC